MSRIGKKTLTIPDGVQLTITDRTFSFKGKLGELSFTVPEGIEWTVEDGAYNFTRLNDKPKYRSLHGLTGAMLRNCLIGVTEGYTKVMEVLGTGYKAEASDDKITLILGYSHKIIMPYPKGIKAEVKGNKITVLGIDKHLVGWFSSKIRGSRPPEPYKGKGVRYSGEYVRKKAGKSASK